MAARVAEFLHYPLDGKIDLYLLPTTRFKTTTIKIYAYRPLDEKTTAAALMMQVMRRGSRGFPSTRKILSFLEECYGASMTMAVLKVGERHVLYTKIEAISDKYLPRGRTLDRVLAFLRDLLLRPLQENGGMRAEYVDQEKRNLRHLIEGLINDRMEYAYERLIQEMCRDEPYRRYEMGTVGEIDAQTPESLLALHGATMRGAPIIVLASGDFSPDALARKLGAALQIPGRAPGPMPETRVLSEGAGGRAIVEKRDVEQGKLIIGCRTGTTLGSPDYTALSAYNALLGGFPHSRLFVNVREKEGLAYYAHSMLDASKGLLFISCGIDFAAYDKCLPVIRSQMEDLCAGNIGDDEWDKTITCLLDRVRKWNDDPAARMGAFTEMLINGAPRTPDEVLERVKSLSRKEVAEAGRKVKWDTSYFLTKE